jgi:hypothetical protein
MFSSAESPMQTTPHLNLYPLDRPTTNLLRQNVSKPRYCKFFVKAAKFPFTDYVRLCFPGYWIACMHIAFAVGCVKLTEKTSTGLELKKVNILKMIALCSQRLTGEQFKWRSEILPKIFQSNISRFRSPKPSLPSARSPKPSLPSARSPSTRPRQRSDRLASVPLIALFPPTHFSEDLAYA